MLSKPELVLLEKLQEEINNRANILAQGGVKDYSEYKQATGFIDGLKLAIDLVNDTNKELTGGQR